MRDVVFREAITAAELEQVHRLNHQVFAEEVGQHAEQASGILVDKFHARNRYFVAVRSQQVVAMVSAHAGPCFSVTSRLPDSSLLQQFDRPVEVRLLAVAPGERSGTLLAGVLWQVFDFACKAGFSHLLISAIDTRQAMYRKLGFRALGPAVAEGEVRFMPMFMSLAEQMRGKRCLVDRHQRRWRARERAMQPINLLPGPVQIAPQVEAAFHIPPISHRCEAFISLFGHARERLSCLMAGLPVAVFPGAGTLANDVVAANLKAIFGNRRGLVLSNGEFGDRIALQAAAAHLDFEQLSFRWGSSWHMPDLRQALDRRPAWVWAVHLETSTGVLNPLDLLLSLAPQAGASVAVDCVSSLGAVPLGDPTGSLLMASGVSGKSLGSYAGLAFVALSDAAKRSLRDSRLPACFNVLRMLESVGPVSTVSSPLLGALASALDRSYSSASATSAHFARAAALGGLVRQGLRSLGIHTVASEDHAAPNITTFNLPGPDFVEDCLRSGFQIAHESSYLIRRGWAQIATMGDVESTSVANLFDRLRQHPDISARRPVPLGLAASQLSGLGNRFAWQDQSGH